MNANLVARLRMGGAVPLRPLCDFTFFTFDVGQLHYNLLSYPSFG